MVELKQKLIKEDLTKVPVGQSMKIVTKEQLKEIYPDYKEENLTFYLEVLVDYLRMQLGMVTKEQINKQRFNEALKRADIIFRRNKIES